MTRAAEIARLQELQQSLPRRFQEATQAVSDTEQDLARLLAMRTAGLDVRGSQVATARMAHARALRDLDDLRKMQAVLPDLLRASEPVLRVAHSA